MNSSQSKNQTKEKINPYEFIKLPDKKRKNQLWFVFYGTECILWTDRIYDYIFYRYRHNGSIGCDRGADHESVGCHQRSDLRYDHG